MLINYDLVNWVLQFVIIICFQDNKNMCPKKSTKIIKKREIVFPQEAKKNRLLFCTKAGIEEVYCFTVINY